MQEQHRRNAEMLKPDVTLRCLFYFFIFWYSRTQAAPSFVRGRVSFERRTRILHATSLVFCTIVALHCSRPRLDDICYSAAGSFYRDTPESKGECSASLCWNLQLVVESGWRDNWISGSLWVNTTSTSTVPNVLLYLKSILDVRAEKVHEGKQCFYHRNDDSNNCLVPARNVIHVSATIRSASTDICAATTSIQKSTDIWQSHLSFWTNTSAIVAPRVNATIFNGRRSCRTPAEIAETRCQFRTARVTGLPRQS